MSNKSIIVFFFISFVIFTKQLSQINVRGNAGDEDDAGNDKSDGGGG